MGARHRHTGCDAAARHSARGRWCAAPLLASRFLLVAPGARAEAADPRAEAEPAQPPTAPVSELEQAETPAAVDEGPPPPAQAAVAAPAALGTPEQGAARPVPIDKTFTRVPPTPTPTPEEAPGPRSTQRTEAGAGAHSGTLPRLGTPLRALQGYLALVRRRLASGGEPPRRALAARPKPRRRPRQG
jgi:hypothetical protein